MMRMAAGSIALGLAVFGLKSAAWWLTGSAALYSDALESVVNVAAALIAYAALRLAARPADANHPYGHAKAEFFAAVIEGGLIVAAAVLILSRAWQGWLDPRPLALPRVGLALTAVSSVLNGAWAVLLLRAGGRFRSPALGAEGRHLRADAVTSCGVIAGLGLALGTGQLWLDPAIAAATAAHVLYSGMHLISESVGGLMDAAPPPEIVERIRVTVSEHAEGALEAHDLRTRHAGRLAFLEFHLVVPGEMRVDQAHDICDRVEAALRAEMAHLVITIHVEPDSKAKHRGVVVL